MVDLIFISNWVLIIRNLVSKYFAKEFKELPSYSQK
jgi:hypothetical protein